MIGKKIIYKDTLESTNNYVANLILEAKIEHGTVILAGNQTQGKGQRSAKWDSEPYKNVAFSCFLKHDNLTVNQQFLLNQVISLACVTFLKRFQTEFKIKWPNDLLFGSQKIAGILVENQLEGNKIKSSIVGIGVNVNQKEFGEYHATSLSLITGKEFILEELVFSLTEDLNLWYNELLNFSFPKIQSSYLEKLWLLNQKSHFEDANGKFEGEIVGVDEFGRLLLEVGNETRAYQNKEIIFLERK